MSFNNKSLGILTRCQPLLGTFVDITVCQGLKDLDLDICLTKAFDHIKTLESYLSIFNPESDVSKINSLAINTTIRIHPSTYNVIKKAQEFCNISKGVFDCAYNSTNATSLDIVVLPAHKVYLKKQLTLDLGGIAKGYIVDDTVRFLKKMGIESGMVNAGGDLRCFGSFAPDLWARLPDATHLKFIPNSEKKAIATSIVGQKNQASQGYWNGVTKQPFKKPFQVIIAAPTCVTADALTKIVGLMGELSLPILKKYRAVRLF